MASNLNTPEGKPTLFLLGTKTNGKVELIDDGEEPLGFHSQSTAESFSRLFINEPDYKKIQVVKLVASFDKG